MPFVKVEEKPPLNAQFVPAYNVLVEFCRSRGWPVDQKAVSDPIEQNDLNRIRTEILTALPLYINLSKPRPVDPAKDCDLPFEPVLINNGDGFLMMPGMYTSTGGTVYSENPVFPESVPVLWEHFADLASIMNTLTARKADYYCVLDVKDDMVQVDVLFPYCQGSVTESHNVTHGNVTNRITDRWDITYPGHSEEIKNAAGFYYYYHLQPCGTESITWTRLSTNIPPENRNRLDLDFTGPAGRLLNVLNAPHVDACHLWPVLFFEDTVAISQPEYQPDTQTNDVVSESNCESCQGGKCSNARDMVQSGISSRNGQMAEALALSTPGNTGISVKHRMFTFSFAGADYGQYNCDTRIEEKYSGAAQDKEGNNAAWNFSYLRRPSGALIPFCWSTVDDEPVGTPLNGYSYRMFRENGKTEVRYSDGISHILSDDELSSCRRTFQLDLEIPRPGEDVSLHDITNRQYSFDSPAIGPLILTVNAKAYPISCVPAQPAVGRSQGDIRSLTSEDPGKIIMSSGTEDISGFAVADFFPAGEVPELGALIKCAVTDFYDALDQLKSKYVVRDYEDGVVAKGFWNRENGILEPMELSLFFCEPDPAVNGQFIQRTRRVKYGSAGRRESEKRTLRRSFPFGERTVAKYRHYDTPEQMTASYEYGIDQAQGSYGKLTFSSDFNGTWRKLFYDAQGRLTKEITPWLDSQKTAAESQCDVTTYDYSPLQPDEITGPGDSRHRTVVRKVRNSEVSRDYYLYFAAESWQIQAAAPGALYTASNNLVTKSSVYTAGEFAGHAWKTENPDGSTSETVYARTAEGGLVTTLSSGRLPDYGTRQIVTTNRKGLTLSDRQYDIATELLIGGADYTYDDYGRRLTKTTIDDEVSTTEYNCCGPRFITEPDGSVTEYSYDTFNRLRFTSQAGVATLYGYDANNNVIEETVVGKEGGELTSFSEYDTDGELIASTDSSGAVTHYSRGVLWQETVDALGNTTRAEYFLDGRIKSISGTGAIPKTYTYGVSSGQLYTREAASGTEWAQTYTDFLGRQSRTTYADGFSQTTSYDALGRQSKLEYSTGSKELTFYHPDSGQIQYRVVKRLNSADTIDWINDGITQMDTGCIQIDDEVFGFTQDSILIDGTPAVVYRYETRRDGKCRIQIGMGQKHIWESVDIGNGEKHLVTTDFNGAVSTQYYEEGQLVKTEDSQKILHYFNDQFNRQTGYQYIADGIVKTVGNILDPGGRILEETESAGGQERTRSFSYDLLGRKTAETSPEGIETFYVYTSNGQLAATSGGVYRQEYEYDEQGRKTKAVTWQNDDIPQETRFEYDNRGRCNRKIYPDGTSERWSYRGDGLLSTHTNVRGQVLSYSYNRAGEVSSVSGANLTYGYDRNGRLANLTDRSGRREFSYDQYGRILSESLPHVNGLTFHWNYDAKQRLSAMDWGPRVSYLCFNDDAIRCIRRISETNDETKLEFAMGAWEERTTLTYQPLNTTCRYNGIAYDDFGRPASHPHFNKHRERLSPYLIDEPSNPSSQYLYDEDGRLRQVRIDGSTLTYTYLPGSSLIAVRTWCNANGRAFLTEQNLYDEYRRLIQIKLNGVSLISYGLNDDDRRTGAVQADGAAWEYSYDSVGQLMMAEKGSTPGIAYSYDDIGNRRSVQENGLATIYTANLLNQYTGIDAETPTYDADGNMLTNDGWTYAWDTENRLLSAARDNLRFEANYDYMGRRFEKKVFNGTELILHQRFAYDGYKLQGIFDALDGNRLLASFLWQKTGSDIPLTMTYGDVTYFYAADGNKNILKLLRSDGTEAASYSYSPFGGILTQSGPLAAINPFRFSSEYHDDETGLVYYNYRYYDPARGRWLSRDSIGEAGGVNLYCFGNNNPINMIDMFGRWSTTIHKDSTRRWAIRLGITEEAATIIADADEEVDNWKKLPQSNISPAPWVGKQGYHFNHNQAGEDSRIAYFEKHFKQAKMECTLYKKWGSGVELITHMPNPQEAAIELGTGLHPHQDWVAHADYGFTVAGDLFSIHNSHSPQSKIFGDVGDYPDLPNLDVVGSPDGRATRKYMKIIHVNSVAYPPMGPPIEYSIPEEYALYEFGNKRLKLTKDRTENVLSKFIDFLKSDQQYRECRCFFLSPQKEEEE